jgi:cytochrome P450
VFSEDLNAKTKSSGAYLFASHFSTIKSAVEELLRYTSPVFMTTERYAREDVTLRGVTIPRGEMTLGVIGSAKAR